MSDSPVAHPEPEDDRYDLRTKLTLARAHAKLGDAGVYDHALAALAELAMGKTMAGKPLKNLHPRTQVQAANALLRSAGRIIPKTHEVSGPGGAGIPIDLGLPETEEEQRDFVADLARAARESDAVTPPKPDDHDDDGASDA